MRPLASLAASVLLMVTLGTSTWAKGGGSSPPAPTPTPAPAGPPAPVLSVPASGAALMQPLSLGWNPVPTTPSGGAIVGYTWQVGTTSAFTTIILAGFESQAADPSIPLPTGDKVSGLPNGSYFWRVKATGTSDSPWSATRTFTVTGLGSAPATPAFSTPANHAQYHIREFFDIKWSAVPGAQYYVLEADDEPTFSYPLNLQLANMNFGTQFHAGWGNAPGSKPPSACIRWSGAPA